MWYIVSGYLKVNLKILKKGGKSVALINCPECGKEISDQAASCPNCGTPIKKGDKKFCLHCGESIDKDCVICPKCGKQVKEIERQDKGIVINNNNNAVANANASIGGLANMTSPKSRLVSLLLCLFLGWLGIHRFYVGKIGTGIIWLFTLGFMGFGVLIDFIIILLGSFRDKNGFWIKNW